MLIKSSLSIVQKHRTNSKKIGAASDQRSAHSSLINGPGFANLTHPTPPSSSLIGCGVIQKHAASAQYPSQALSIAPRQQCTGCSMRMPDLVEFPDNNALQRYQMGLESQPLALLQQRNTPLQNYGHQQRVNESAQCPPYAPAPSVGFTSPMNNTHQVYGNEAMFADMLNTVSWFVSRSSSPDLVGQFSFDTAIYNDDSFWWLLFSSLMQNFFEDLGFGEDFPFLDSYIQDNNGAM